MIRKVKHTVPWTYVISYLNGEGIVRTFYEKEYPKTTLKKSQDQKDKL